MSRRQNIVTSLHLLNSGEPNHRSGKRAIPLREHIVTKWPEPKWGGITPGHTLCGKTFYTGQANPWDERRWKNVQTCRRCVKAQQTKEKE